MSETKRAGDTEKGKIMDTKQEKQKKTKKKTGIFSALVFHEAVLMRNSRN
jgi:hypothetical protein